MAMGFTNKGKSILQEAMDKAIASEQTKITMKLITGPITEQPPADRFQLVNLCNLGIVPQARWQGRMSHFAQRQLGEARSLLLADCDWWFDTFSMAKPVNKQELLWWVRVRYRASAWFDTTDKIETTELFFIPSQTLLDAAQGQDWYQS